MFFGIGIAVIGMWDIDFSGFRGVIIMEEEGPVMVGRVLDAMEGILDYFGSIVIEE